jgi:flavin-dependent dehydrogenase
VPSTLRRNGIRKADVAVLGGGPAGTALALQMINRGYSAIVIERSDYCQDRVGETLPPAVQPLLTKIGVWDQFLAAKHSPSFGIRSAWGQDNLYDNDFIFSPYGSGWHVDRTCFDTMLACCTEDAGATVYREARLLSCESDKGRDWEIQFACGDRRHRYLTKFLVDATGRASWLARKQGARRITSDRLVGVLGFLVPNPAKPASDSFTLIEAVESGWWYSAVLPDSRLVVAHMTDADIYADGRKQSSDYWLRQLQRTKHTRSRAKQYVQAANLIVVSANSSRLDRVGDGNWLAVGDAAIAFDPLSGQGVYKALESAVQASESIHQYWTGNKSALRDYEIAVRENFERYCLTRAAFYSKEKRWPRATFWQRRTAG